MSILNVNQIQPVGSGQTITISASDITASSATITASSVTANLTGNVTGNLTGNVTGNVTSSSTSTFSSGLNVTGGSVGIGTDNPATNLHISSTGTPTIQITDEDNSGIVKIENGSGSLFLNADTGNSVSNSRIGFYIDGSERLRITSTATLLLGQTTEAGVGGTPPDLNSTEVGRGYINLARDDTAAADHILFGKNGSIASSIGTDTTNTLVFKTGTTERLRIDSSGRTGIGIIPSNFGNNANSLELHSPNSTQTYLTLTNTTTGSNGATNGLNLAMIGTSARFLNRENGEIQFQINGTERLRILSGGGITFNGDTAAANALDDYEEGTWTPVATNVTVNSGTPTYSGNYTKIGNIVHANMAQSGGNITFGSGSRFSGLPFTTSDKENGWYFCTASGKKGVANNYNGTLYVYSDEGQTPSNISQLKISVVYRVS